jgi:hypothetical protein
MSKPGSPGRARWQARTPKAAKDETGARRAFNRTDEPLSVRARRRRACQSALDWEWQSRPLEGGLPKGIDKISKFNTLRMPLALPRGIEPLFQP